MRELVDALNGALRRVPVWPFYVVGFVPAAIYLWLALRRTGWARTRCKVLEHELGLIALQLLIAALCVTPLRELTRRQPAALPPHAGADGVLLRAACTSRSGWCSTASSTGRASSQDLTKRPYIILGMSAFLMLMPLAATSWDGAVRRLGGAALAPAAPAGLSGDGAGGDPLRLAGEGLAARAADLRRDRRGAARLAGAARPARRGAGVRRRPADAPDGGAKKSVTRARFSLARLRRGPLSSPSPAARASFAVGKSRVRAACCAQGLARWVAVGSPAL